MEKADQRSENPIECLVVIFVILSSEYELEVFPSDISETELK